jgi:hypothetical protein
MTLKEWLDTPCKPEEIAYLDAEKTIAYIPIGVVESILDEGAEFGWDWSITNFKFGTFKSVNTTFVSGSIELTLVYGRNNQVCAISRVGAATLPVYTRDDNQDYEGTILSLALSNAAKKLGQRFGRHLNGRMEVGETAVKIKKEPEVINRADERWKDLIGDCKTIEELAAYKPELPEHMNPVYMQKLKQLTTGIK